MQPGKNIYLDRKNNLLKNFEDKKLFQTNTQPQNTC